MFGFGGFGKRRGLRQWIVVILQREPKNGAELMDAMETMSQGWWRPSPGSVYPVLEELANEGVVRKRDDGRYEMTSKGRDASDWTAGWLGGRPRTAKDIVDEVGSYVAYLEDLARSEQGGVAAERQRLGKLAQRLQELAN
ncbi:MAG: PadR family transcriptional regulator [Thermoplasmata archaeon]|nr:PadR family transcriptional regulator [Thermoplasmata archaeon]